MLTVGHLGHALDDVGSIVGRDIDASKSFEANPYGFVKGFSSKRAGRGILRNNTDGIPRSILVAVADHPYWLMILLAHCWSSAGALLVGGHQRGSNG